MRRKDPWPNTVGTWATAVVVNRNERGGAGYARCRGSSAART